jgi:hypothetical protein
MNGKVEILPLGLDTVREDEEHVIESKNLLPLYISTRFLWRKVLFFSQLEPLLTPF